MGRKISKKSDLSAAKIDALIRSEARLRTILAAEPECVKTVDRDYNLVDMNSAGLNMIEADNLDQVRGESVLGLIMPEYHDLFRSSVDDAFAGKTSRVQFEMVSLNGVHHFMEQSAAALFDPNNPDRVIEMLAVTRDITEQRDMIDTLKAARAESQAASENLEQEVAARLRDVRLIGEITGIINENDRPEDVLQKLIDQLCSRTQWKTGHVWLCNPETLELRSSRIWALNTPDKFLNFIAESRQRTYQSDEGLPGKTAKLARPIWVTRDKGFRCDRFHRNGGEHLNTGCAFPIISGQGVIGVVEFFSDEKIERVDDLIDNFAHIGTQIGRVFERAEDRKRLAIAYDDMEQRVAERTVDLLVATDQAQAGNRMKSDFLANMSHEIRTPMNGVLGMLQVLARTELNQDQSKILETIEQSGQNLVTIIDDILDLSKIEAGSLELEAVLFDIADTIEASTSIFAASADEKSLKLNTHIETGISGDFIGDPFRIRQILNNLISNAIKFTDSGSISISVKPHKTTGESANQLLFSVCDTGAGMEGETCDTLFMPFTQADTSITRKFGGTGLGLAICRQLCELMGGKIEVHSAPGKGSTFSFFLPLEQAEISADREAFEPSLSSDEQLALVSEVGTLHILAAEDVATNQIVLRALLAPVCASLTIVENGREAIESWDVLKPDVILMDMQMPVLDGLSATRQIRLMETANNLPRTPIIALTANIMQHQREEYLAAGADGLVGKPFRLEQLIAALVKTQDGDIAEPDEQASG